MSSRSREGRRRIAGELRPARVLVVAAAITAGAGAVPSCGGGPRLSIAYQLSIDGAGTEPTATGWTTTTDLGFEVEVLEGTISAYAATLVPCTSPTTTAAVRLREALLPVARAGHSENADPSSIEPIALLPLAATAHRALGETVVTARCYQAAHWLVSGAIDAAAETPIRAPSLTLALDVRRGGAPIRNLSFSTTVATGAIEPIEETGDGGGELEVVVTWPLAPLFDGIDFASDELGDGEIARSILLSLAREAHAEAHGVVSVDPSR